MFSKNCSICCGYGMLVIIFCSIGNIVFDVYKVEILCCLEQE